MRKQDLYVYRGDTTRLIFENIPDLTGALVKFQVRLNPNDALPVISKEPLETDPGNDWSNGIVAVNLTEGSTQGLTETIYFYDLKITRPAFPQVQTEYYGYFKLQLSSTKAGTMIDPVPESDIYSNLASNLAGKGASLIGVLFSYWNGIFGTLTVEGALQWLYENTLKTVNPFTGGKILKSGTTGNDMDETGIIVDTSDNISNLGNVDLKSGSIYK